MDTVGYVLILVGALVLNQVTRGRSITQIPTDLGHAVEGIVTGNAAMTKAALTATGDSSTAIGPTPATSGSSGASAFGGSSDLLSAMHSLGDGKPYVYGASGPNAYDCSGLLWAACKQVGLYTGPRFTTVTVIAALGSKVTKTATPAVGDIVWWPTHCGVVDGDGTMYSALNPKDGIKSSPLSWGPKNEGSPVFYSIVSGSIPAPAIGGQGTGGSSSGSF